MSASLVHCARCQQNKSPDAFCRAHKGEERRQRYCKSCMAALRREERTKIKAKNLQESPRPTGLIRCQRCHQSKPTNEFYKDITRKNGLCSKCRACVDLSNKSYAATHKEQIAMHNKAYGPFYRAANQKKIRRDIATWEKKNPDKVKASRDRKNRSRLARMRHASIIESIDMDIIYLRDKKICSLCHTSVKRSDATLDHIVPLSKGGNHTYANVALAHHRCNSSKGNRIKTQQMRLF